MLIQGSGIRPLRDPIIRSWLDLDFYKLTMLQFIFLSGHGNTNTTFGLNNRTRSVRLAEIIPIEAIREQLDHVLGLRYTDQELDYLSTLELGGSPIFLPVFIDFLRTRARLSQYQLYEREAPEGGRQLHVEFPGPWLETSPWETIALSIINELYYHYSLTPDERAIGCTRGMRRLEHKIRVLQRLEESFPTSFNIIEFGTRRRFSREWQRAVIEQLVDGWGKSGLLLGVSNVAFAREFGLTPMGTMAHELFMIYAGIFNDTDEMIRASQMRVLDEWQALFGPRLSVALPDTFGSQAFFEDFGRTRAEAWKALRQDSGVPSDFGEELIRFYKRHDIDAQEKRLVPSDGLKLRMIIDLVQQFRKRIGLTFGWGTDLTNDLGFPALSLVVKAIWANGHPLVKLSDNLAKATGRKDEIERYKRIFGYTSEFREECTY